MALRRALRLVFGSARWLTSRLGAALVPACVALGCGAAATPPKAALAPPAVAVCPERATQSPPEVAAPWLERGEALVRSGESGDNDAFEAAKQPLTTCIEKDARAAECHELLGEAQLHTDDPQLAAVHFTQAVRLDPARADYYRALADIYLMFKRYAEATIVLELGTQLAATEQNQVSLFKMQMALAYIASQRQDMPAQLAALDRAEGLATNLEGELLFELGDGYATLNPPQKERALRVLNQFFKRVCRGARAASFVSQCETAQSDVQRLGQ
ncbi:MAG TPA: hypothetical protein VNG33_08755 [Polyangiaceae bacterium]|nr:hypothetical protein [Polyangiaceae bacterium]